MSLLGQETMGGAHTVAFREIILIGALTSTPGEADAWQYGRICSRVSPLRGAGRPIGCSLITIGRGRSDARVVCLPAALLVLATVPIETAPKRKERGV